MTQGADNRKHERVAINDDAPAVVVHLQGVTGITDTRHVHAHDLSRTGMGFSDKHPAKLGTKATILLHHRGRSLRVIGKVTNCRQGPDGRHVIGVRFTSIAQIPVETPIAPGELTDSPIVDRLMIDV